MKTRSGQKLNLTSVEELLGVPNEESSIEIEIDRIRDFKDHPFKVLDDEKMDDLAESIRSNGVLSPVIVRPTEEDTYEMVSGHRRMHACKLVGLTMIPAIVREMTDDEAVVYMVDSNIQREELLPSEKAFAFKMKMDAMRHQGTTSRHDVDKLGIKSAEIVGGESGIGGRQVQRYIRLTELLPELLDMVDSKRLQFTAAVEISYLDKAIQGWICEYIHESGNVNQKQISLLRQAVMDGKISQNQMIDILNDSAIGRIPKKKVTFSEKKLYQYFPPHYTSAQMEQVIEKLLTEWKNSQSGHNEDF